MPIPIPIFFILNRVPICITIGTSQRMKGETHEKVILRIRNDFRSNITVTNNECFRGPSHHVGCHVF